MGNQIIEIVHKMLEVNGDLNEDQKRYLNAVQESGYDLMGIIEDLLRLKATQWDHELVGALRNELYMRASNIVLFTQGFRRINDVQEASLYQIEDSGQNMLRIIQRLCDQKQ